ncbi:CBF/Mak21 family-domain-containing protein [Umbelopsis sp. AD052]|nr:CBF/Mak21 family-domain-containing protein [Umbelopsis sp. AD052]
MPQPIKKRKRGEVTGSRKDQDYKDTIQRIKVLESGLGDKSNLNNLVEIFEIAQGSHGGLTSAAIHALHRVYTTLLLKGELRRLKKEESAKATVSNWLRDNYNSYIKFLCELLRHEEPGLQKPALNILITLLKSESEFQTSLRKKHSFANDFYVRVVDAVLRNPNFSQPLQAELLGKYLNVYDDLRYYFFKNTSDIITSALESKDSSEADTPKKKKAKNMSNEKLNMLMQNTFSVLEGIRTMPTAGAEIDEFWTGHPDPEYAAKAKEDPDAFADSSDEEEEVAKEVAGKKGPRKHMLVRLSVHKKALQTCWLAFMKMPLSNDLYKKTLLIMHKRIIPHMTDPRLLMDFLTDSYNAGGATALLALNSLFTLIVDYNLDYPEFYHKLYRLLDANVLHLKYRSRFFRLLDLFLSSSHLPASLIAAFIKRMARLSLTAPPAGSVILIAMIYNLLKRHPSCMALIHRDEVTDMETDAFDESNPDPYTCNALNSSLWELQTLAEHYYPNVATLAKIFTEQFTKPSYNLEDFLDHTYGTFLDKELTRKRKKDPALAFEKPTELFPSLVKVGATDEDDETANDNLEDPSAVKWSLWAF